MGVPTNARLLKMAAYTGVLTTSGAAYLYYKMQNRLKNSQLISEPVKLLEQNEHATTYLGKPITTGYMNIQVPEKNFCDGLKAHFEVPVKGVNNSGILYIWADRGDLEDSWNFNRLELSPSNNPSKRLIIKKED